MGYGGGRGGGLDAFLSVLSMFSQAQGSGSWGKGNGKGKGKGKGKDPNYRTMTQINEISEDRKVKVSGLPDDVTWKELEAHFELNATKPLLTEVHSKTAHSMLAKGTGICAFKTAEEAIAAIAAVDGSKLKDNTIQVDVWTEKCDPNKQKMVPGGADKRALEQRVKQLQRSGPEAKATWMAFTAEHHGGVNDPSKHTKETLEEFLAAFT